MGVDEIRELNTWAVDGLAPELTILLDLDPEIGSARVGEEKDRLESAGDAFHRRVRKTFLDIAASEPDRFVIIDASRTVAEIAADIRAGYERL